MYDWDGGETNHVGEYVSFDYIRLNKHYMTHMTADQQRDAVAHEVGHSLGIGDHDTDPYKTILMYYANNGVTSPQKHD